MSNVNNPRAPDRIKGTAELRQKYLIGKAYPGKESEEKLYWLCSSRPLKYFKGMSIDFLVAKNAVMQITACWGREN